MGLNFSIQKMSACDVKYIQQSLPGKYILITTITDNLKTVPLIKGTLTAHEEETKINQIINHNDTTNIVIYGRNNQDMSVITKYKQLLKLGITNVYVYIGGLFEWLLLNKCYPQLFHIESIPASYNEWLFHPPANNVLMKGV